MIIGQQQLKLVGMERWIFDSIRLGDRNPKIVALIESHFSELEQLSTQDGQTILHAASDSCNMYIIDTIFKVYKRNRQQEPNIYHDQRKHEWVNTRDMDGFTALHYAVFRHDLKVVKLLERQGADAYTANSDGLTCIHLAAQGGSPLLIYYFMAKGIKIGSPDARGNTALHWAAYAGMDHAVSALVAWGAELDRRQDAHGMTPLHLGVLAASGKVVKKLLLAGCDRKLLNREGKRAIDLAKQKEYRQLQDMIKDQLGPLELLGLRPRYRTSKPRSCSFYITLILLIASCICNIPYYVLLEQTLFTDLAIADAVFGALCLFLLVILTRSDPGIIQNEETDLGNILQKVTPNKICFECGIVKPPLSRHCTVCNFCVAVYDHHCPWVGNCIGANNYFLFFLFLSVIVGYCCFNLVFHIINFVQVGINFKESIIVTLKLIGSGFAFIISSILILPLGYLLLIHIKNAAQGRTTLQRFRKATKPTVVGMRPRKASRRLEPTLLDKMSTFSANTHNTVSAIPYEEYQQQSNCYRMFCSNKKNQAFYYASA